MTSLFRETPDNILHPNPNAGALNPLPKIICFAKEVAVEIVGSAAA
jgi:hypothetical protein